MKRFYYQLILILAVSCAALTAQANQVIVKGYVKFANGTPAANHRVTIAVDTFSTNTCLLFHVKFTDANGFYRDTLSCSTNILRVRITTPNCNGALLVHEPQVTPGGVVESDFTLSCNPIPNNCESAFSYTRSPNSLVVHFNSAASHGTSVSDSIVRRKWKFGDSDTLGGNVINPTHTYAQRGVYQSCLTIWTASGCEKTECKIVNVTDSITPSNNCVAQFNFTKSVTPLSVVVAFNSGASQGSTATDAITHWQWNLGNGYTSNLQHPTSSYFQNGQFQVCLTIKTASGCIKTECKTISITEIVPPIVHCKARFTVTPLPLLPSTPGFPVKFNSSMSEVSQGDSIRERIWKFGDGSTSAGSQIDPIHNYSIAGSYNVCLIIRTVRGCSDTTCITIHVPMQGQVSCSARFNYTPVSSSSTVAGNTIKFQSNISHAGAGDSIISRLWQFGDGTSLSGNTIDPLHSYTQPDLYTVCLKITTARGCQSQECKQVVVSQHPNCKPYFTSEKVAPKKIRFNSGMSWVPVNDTIIERKWDFGDGTPILSGNVINPLHEYLHYGIYTVCLKIKTARGCEARLCAPVRVTDSLNTPVNTAPIKIVSLYPNPVMVQMNTVVWSLHNNVNATLAIYDIYGVKKWSLNKVLLQGNNVTVVPTANLMAGPYFFRVTTIYGIQSRQFYKL
jgi:PKD repeat protein